MLSPTVGPVWEGGRNDEEEILASCYRRSLEVADVLGARSVAFPAISTGIFGFPKRLAAEVAVRTLSGTVTEVEQIILVAFDQGTFDLYTALLTEQPFESATDPVRRSGTGQRRLYVP